MSLFNLRSKCCNTALELSSEENRFVCSDCHKDISYKDTLTPCCDVHPDLTKQMSGLPEDEYICSADGCYSTWNRENVVLYLDTVWLRKEGLYPL